MFISTNWEPGPYTDVRDAILGLSGANGTGLWAQIGQRVTSITQSRWEARVRGSVLSSRESNPDVCWREVDIPGPAQPEACSAESDAREDRLEGRLPLGYVRDQGCSNAILQSD